MAGKRWGKCLSWWAKFAFQSPWIDFIRSCHVYLADHLNSKNDRCQCHANFVNLHNQFKFIFSAKLWWFQESVKNKISYLKSGWRSGGVVTTHEGQPKATEPRPTWKPAEFSKEKNWKGFAHVACLYSMKKVVLQPACSKIRMQRKIKKKTYLKSF